MCSPDGSPSSWEHLPSFLQAALLPMGADGRVSQALPHRMAASQPRAQHCVSLLPGPRLSCFSPWAEHRTELQSSVQFPTFLTFIIGFKVSDLCRSLSFTRLRLADTSVLRIALCERLDLCFKSLFFLDWKIHVWTSFYQ